MAGIPMEEAVDRALHGDCVSIFIPTLGRWTTGDTLLGLPADVLVLAVNTLLARQEDSGLQDACRLRLSCVVVSGSQVTDLLLATQLKQCDATMTVLEATNFASYAIDTWKHGAVRQHVLTFMEAMQSIKSAQALMSGMPACKLRRMHTLLQLNLEFTSAVVLDASSSPNPSLCLVGLAGVAEANLRASLEQISYNQADNDRVPAPKGLCEDLWYLLRPLLGASALLLEYAGRATQSHWRLTEVGYQNNAPKVVVKASAVKELEVAKAEVLHLRALLARGATPTSTCEDSHDKDHTAPGCGAHSPTGSSSDGSSGSPSSSVVDAILESDITSPSRPSAISSLLSVTSNRSSWAPDTPDGATPFTTQASRPIEDGVDQAPHTARLQAAALRLATTPSSSSGSNAVRAYSQDGSCQARLAALPSGSPTCSSIAGGASEADFDVLAARPSLTACSINNQPHAGAATAAAGGTTAGDAAAGVAGVAVGSKVVGGGTLDTALPALDAVVPLEEQMRVVFAELAATKRQLGMMAERLNTSLGAETHKEAPDGTATIHVNTTTDNPKSNTTPLSPPSHLPPLRATSSTASPGPAPTNTHTAAAAAPAQTGAHLSLSPKASKQPHTTMPDGGASDSDDNDLWEIELGLPPSQLQLLASARSLPRALGSSGVVSSRVRQFGSAAGVPAAGREGVARSQSSGARTFAPQKTLAGAAAAAAMGAPKPVAASRIPQVAPVAVKVQAAPAVAAPNGTSGNV